MAQDEGAAPLIALATSRPSRVDAVPLAALLLGGLFFFLPFLALKENRVVSGRLLTAGALMTPLMTVLLVAAACAVFWAAVFGGHRPFCRLVYAGVGIGAFWLSIALLVRGGALLPQGPAARVSPAIGFWGLPVVSYILLDHAHIKGWGRRLILAATLILPAILLLSGGRFESLAMVQEWSSRKDRFLGELIKHIRLSAGAVLAAAVLGVPMGILARRSPHLERPLIAFVDAVQTIPSLALFGLLMGPLAWLSREIPLLRTWGVRGIGTAPALIALTLYALLPITRNTVTGLSEVPSDFLEAGRGLGMTDRQLFWKVRLPIASPHILAGLRTASVQAVGNTAVAALIGAGGLGTLIFQGLGQAAPDLVLLGVAPLIVLSVAADRGWGVLIRYAVPRGLRKEVQG